MKVLCFVEGSSPLSDSVGHVGVPRIAESLANSGHQVILIVVGGIILGTERFVCPNINSALQRKSGSGTFGIVNFPAHGSWRFAPSIVLRLSRQVQDADLISLHSLYSFPVLVGYMFARLYHKPYVLWPHGVLAPFQRRVNASRKKVYDWVIARRILNQARKVVFTASGEREETLRQGFDLPSVIVPQGIDAQLRQIQPGAQCHQSQ